MNAGKPQFGIRTLLAVALGLALFLGTVGHLFAHLLDPTLAMRRSVVLLAAGVSLACGAVPCIVLGRFRHPFLGYLVGIVFAYFAAVVFITVFFGIPWQWFLPW
jgi:hypothetical protein